MRPRFYQTILAVACAAVVSPVLAQVDLEVKVMRVDKFEVAPSVITGDIVKHFKAEASAVESRLKGSALATLSQELSSTKLMSLAVRDDSLKRLAEEWKLSEELGSGKSEDALTGPSVADADYLAYAKIEELTINRTPNDSFPGFSFTPWNIIVEISLEVTTRKTKTKKVLKEVFEYSALEKSVLTSIYKHSRQPEVMRKSLEQKYDILDSDAGVIRGAMNGLAKKLAQRVLDSYCPIRITSARGKLFNIDRGRAAGLKEGHIMELTERADDEFGTDSGFPIGKARVKTVKEDSSLMELVSDEGVEELKGDRTKLTVTRPVEAKFAEPEPKPVAPSSTPSSKTGSSKKPK
jgi:hypothetical protein